MQKIWSAVLLILLSLTLCACVSVSDDEALQVTNHTGEPEITQSQASIPAEPEKPPHALFYLPDCNVQQMTEYFEEVVLSVEYTDGTGADDLVKKWLSPIHYQVYGEPTDADLEVLHALCEQLNAIPGFPGMYPTVDPSQENMSIQFLDADAFRDSFSAVIHGEEAYGAAQFWYYTLTNELHTARIGCRTDVNQGTRNSVLVEEIINILGISDTVLRADSVTYQYSDDNMTLSDVDLVILELLYSPSMECGFDADSCRDIIQKLYY